MFGLNPVAIYRYNVVTKCSFEEI